MSHARGTSHRTSRLARLTLQRLLEYRELPGVLDVVVLDAG